MLYDLECHVYFEWRIYARTFLEARRQPSNRGILAIWKWKNCMHLSQHTNAVKSEEKDVLLLSYPATAV